MKPSIIKEYQLFAQEIPTDKPESDGTLEWNSTTILVVRLQADSLWGLGYTYAHKSFLGLARELIEDHVVGKDALNISKIWGFLRLAVRNQGRPGASSMVIAAIDVALWDLKAKLLGLSLSQLLGVTRDSTEIYLSGGFTSYDLHELKSAAEKCKSLHIRKFKMKVGRHPQQDEARVANVRETLGPDIELFVDANEAYDLPTARLMAEKFAKYDVRWFEQPIPAQDLAGMSWLRARMPTGMKLASGEYIYDETQLLPIIQQRAVDVVQLDVTRCQGITGFVKCASICHAHNVPLSSHCAPALHAPLTLHIDRFLHIEYFHDHVRVENELFEGVEQPVEGRIGTNPAKAGHGLSLRSRSLCRE